MSFPVRSTVGPWRAVWRGGRLADVYHAEYESPLDALQVGDWDWETDTRPEVNDPQALLDSELEEWVRDHGEEWRAELPFQR